MQKRDRFTRRNHQGHGKKTKALVKKARQVIHQLGAFFEQMLKPQVAEQLPGNYDDFVRQEQVIAERQLIRLHFKGLSKFRLKQLCKSLRNRLDEFGAHVQSYVNGFITVKFQTA